MGGAPLLLAQIPQPPVHEASMGAEFAYTMVMVLVTGGMFAWWLLTGERSRNGVVLPLVLVGGAISALVEPILDNVVLFWYPPRVETEAFYAFGRSVPWYVVIGYAWYCGGLLYFVYRHFQGGVSSRRIWVIFGAIMLVDSLAISLIVQLGQAGFYGEQPFNVGGYPLWWAGIDGSLPVVGAALLFHLVPRLHGWRRVFLLVVPAVNVGLVAGATDWPVSLALNSAWPAVATWLAGASTFALCCGLVWAVTQVIPRTPTAPDAPNGAASDRRSSMAASR